MRWCHRVSLGLSLLQAGQALAQTMALQPGTTLTVAAGTLLRIDGPITWELATGSTCVNDGNIELTPSAVIQEADGAPIMGQGLEHIAVTYANALANSDPGGLGLLVSTAVAPDVVDLWRGHVPMSEAGGAQSVARWYDWSSSVNAGLNAAIAFRYDPVLLNGIAEADQVLHVYAGGSVWSPLPSAVNTAARTVSASGLDSLGTFTTFDGALPTGIARPADRPGAVLMPTVSDTEVRLIAAPTDRSRVVDVFDATGRIVWRSVLPANGGTLTIPVSGLGTGLHLVHVQGLAALRFLRS